MTAAELSTFVLDDIQSELALVERILSADKMEDPDDLANIVEPLLGLDNFHKDVEGPEQLVKLWVMFFHDKPRWVALETVRSAAMSMRRRPMPADLSDHLPEAWTRARAAQVLLKAAEHSRAKQLNAAKARATQSASDHAERVADLSESDRALYDKMIRRDDFWSAAKLLAKKPEPLVNQSSAAQPEQSGISVAAHLAKLKAKGLPKLAGVQP